MKFMQQILFAFYFKLLLFKFKILFVFTINFINALFSARSFDNCLNDFIDVA